MGAVVAVNPFRCRMWSLHDRLEVHVTEDTCRAEIESFQRHGQLVPVLGRKLADDPSHEFELIYGARRLFIARHLNKLLNVELRELSDREAIVAMDIENRHRKDISPYERGLSYAEWLRAGHFRSQDDIARALKVSSSQVSRLLKLARLPSVVVEAFASPLEICEGWGLDLIEILEDPERRQATVNTARAMSNTLPRPPAREVYRQLLTASARGRKVRLKKRDDVVTDASGNPLFRVRHQLNSIALLLPLDKVSAGSLERICCAVSGILQPAKAQVTDFPKKVASHHSTAERL